MSEPHRISPWYLQARDQRPIAWVTALAILAVASIWAWGAWRRGWIEIDAAPRGSVEYQIDLNSADWPEFAQLPLVGETLARRIVEHRQKQGPYRNVDELLRVQGLGKKTLDRVRPYLTLTPRDSATNSPTGK